MGAVEADWLTCCDCQMITDAALTVARKVAMTADVRLRHLLWIDADCREYSLEIVVKCCQFCTATIGIDAVNYMLLRFRCAMLRRRGCCRYCPIVLEFELLWLIESKVFRNI